MKLSKVTQIVLMGALVVGLAACSAKKPNANDNATVANEINANAAAMGNNNSNAQTYASRPVSAFKVARNGMRINPLTAPANQTYYFSFDSNSMRPQDLNALNIQASYLVSHPNATIRLDGNTDDRGSREYNIGLGWRRDQSVARFLKQQGVRPSQIQMVSYGKERPAALGDNPRSWALNRRVDLVYKSYQ